MADKAAAQQQIAALVEKWRSTPQRQREAYTEQQTRIAFILPLFQALGWDIQNPSEVSAEEQISRGFVDFGFYLNGIPAFYLETKRAAEKLEKPDNMRQSINYAYLKGVTWAVLTDFEQLMVFNAEWEETDPLKARFLDLHWEHYTNGQFDDLWLLSKPSIVDHEIDRTAERFGKKNKKEPVTKALFADLTAWRYALFNNIHGMRATLWAGDVQRVDNAVQKLLDRLIFIRSVEDRAVEPPRLQAVLRQSKGKDLYPNLIQLFRELDDIYNSNLFALSDLDMMEVHDPGLLTEIINGLYRSPGGYIDYNFNAIAADVLGAVYEQYLSFRLQDPDVQQQVDKRRKRKAQGIYYTPQFVVRYIVRQTLGKMLESGVDAHSLRILDPACGSGSFLIEAFDVLDRWLALNEPNLPERERRLRILQENLYGVDLDDQAVEVTRLNLMLRAALERGKLPLLTHIKHGNSLIDDPEVAGDHAFRWEDEFPDVMAQGGFDVVIGNPPYGAAITDKQANYYKRAYVTATTSLDTFALFMERAFDLLMVGGLFGMIVPSGWVSAPASRQLRQVFVSHFRPTSFASMPYDVFESAYVDTIVVAGEKLPEGKTLHDFSQAPVELVVFPPRHQIQSLHDFDTYVKKTDAIKWLDGNENQFLVTASDLERELIDRVRVSNGVFRDVADIQRGVTPFEPIKEKPHINPARAFNGTVRRYTITQEDEQFIRYDETLAEYKPPRYFKGARILLRELISRQFQLQAAYTEEDFITNKSMQSILLDDVNYHLYYLLGTLNSTLLSWYFLSLSSVARRDDFPKIVLKQTRELPFRKINFDDPADKTRHDRMVQLVETMLRLKQEHAAAEASISDRRFDLAEQIARTDREIDALVYELYGLTEAEIAVVEGR